MTRMRPSMPASRSSRASFAAATASHAAPPACAARAAGTAPCPYPSALTTAQTVVDGPTCRASRATLRSIAARSTRASARSTGYSSVAAIGWRSLPAEDEGQGGDHVARDDALDTAVLVRRAHPGARVEVHRGARRMPRLHLLGEHRGDHAGEHVAGPGRRERAGGPRVDGDTAVGCGDECVVAFQ